MLEETVSLATRELKPSAYLVAKDDRMTPPAAQRIMAKRIKVDATEAPDSHAV